MSHMQVENPWRFFLESVIAVKRFGKIKFLCQGFTTVSCLGQNPAPGGAQRHVCSSARYEIQPGVFFLFRAFCEKFWRFLGFKQKFQCIQVFLPATVNEPEPKDLFWIRKELFYFWAIFGDGSLLTKHHDSGTIRLLNYWWEVPDFRCYSHIWCGSLIWILSRMEPFGIYMGVSNNRGTPKWMVKIMENPIKMDDLGGKPTIFANTHISLWQIVLFCLFKPLRISSISLRL